MLDQLVHYLRSHNVPFRLSSYPSAEPLPAVGPPVPPGGHLVVTRVLLVGGRAALICTMPGEALDLPRLQQELGAMVIEGTPADLPPPYSRAAGWIPPLGGAMGAVTLVDERAAAGSAVVFAAFSPNDYVEIPHGDFARLELPRIGSFAIAGELPPSVETESSEAQKKVA